MSRQTSTKSGIVIRDMTREDISNVVAIDAEVSSIKSPVSESGVIDSYVTSELGLSCVAEVSGQIVGYILGRLAYTPAPDSESAWIQLIGISPEYRRQGIGKNSSTVSGSAVKRKVSGLFISRSLLRIPLSSHS
jgi:ribosomal protein S18 acetylase RimI-like enzyme